LGNLFHERIDRPARALARILGTRHLAQAAIMARHHTHKWILAGAAVDATHATTIAVVVAVRPDRWKLTLTNVASPTMLAASGVYEARRAGRSSTVRSPANSTVR
jgi:hypothetical protein